jgi:hypothetical protein
MHAQLCMQGENISACLSARVLLLYSAILDLELQGT